MHVSVIGLLLGCCAFTLPICFPSMSVCSCASVTDLIFSEEGYATRKFHQKVYFNLKDGGKCNM